MTWPLEMPLVSFGRRKADVWTLSDALQGVIIFGANGSGKTSGSAALLARKYLAAGFGGLVLCAKTDEAGRWLQCQKTSLKNQLLLSLFNSGMPLFDTSLH
jgi:signal recognition particle GTPase